MKELEEFYPYVEVTMLKESPERWKNSFSGGKSLLSIRKELIDRLDRDLTTKAETVYRSSVGSP